MSVRKVAQECEALHVVEEMTELDYVTQGDRHRWVVFAFLSCSLRSGCVGANDAGGEWSTEMQN